MHLDERRHDPARWAPGVAVPVALLAAGCGDNASVASGTPRPATPVVSPSSMAPTPSASATTPTPSALPSGAPSAFPLPTASPPPLPSGTFLGRIAARPEAAIRSGPGSDMPVVGGEPAGVAELFDGWFRRGDDPPVADVQTGVLEAWSQDWFRLADGRGWIHGAQVEGFQPDAMPQAAWTPPAVRDVPIPEPGRRRIVVSVTRQHLWAFDGSRVVIDTVIGTGRPELPTLHGTYKVFYKASPFRMASDWPRSSPYWYEPAWVEYVMEFISGGYFIHDAPWRTRWGPGANLTAGSHGCVNVPTPVMAAFYRWTALGDEVVVQAS